MSVGLVIGNGGSLAEMPLEFLRRYPSIGSNHIFLLEGFTPTYYIAIDGKLLRRDFYDRVNEMQCIKFIDHRIYDKNKLNNAIEIRTCHDMKFSKNPLSNPPGEGWTVTYVALQFAYRFEWDTVLLVGVDHWSKGIYDHFTDDYLDVEPPAVEDNGHKTLPFYELARYAFEQAGRRVINVTPGSALDIFPKEDWQLWNV